MFLSELELVGFKSFAEKTVLKFTGGLTAIVGPNGCGKSNIVDAIRWVLGEQRVSVLRADSMQNVIFNGSRSRKPLSMAEVSVTFENSRNLLPTEYTEVRITRRLFRDGESQYLLNRSRCRYRDIQELLMDTGIGANAYSVIELSMIDTILSERHEERRKIFDEAAGITRYKLRRRETQRRLDALQADIARIQDLVGEVERSVRSLSRQAKKAERYAKLKEQMLQLLQFLLVQDYQQYAEERQQLQQRLATLQEEKEQEEATLVDEEIAVATVEEQLHQLETALEQRRQQLAQRHTERQQVERQLIIVTERIAALQRTEQQLHQEQEQIQHQLTALEQEAAAIAVKKEQAAQAVATKQEEVDAANAYAVQLRIQLDQQRREVDQLQQQRVELLEYLHKLQAEQEREKARLETIDQRIAEIQQFLQEQQHRQRELATELQQQQQKRAQLQEQLQSLEQQLAAEEAQKAALEQQQRQLQERLSELRSEIRHTEAALEFFRNLAISAEPSRFLLEHSQWAATYHPTPFAELLKVPAAYEEAFSSLLTPYLHTLVVPNAEAVDAAVTLLKEERKGRVSFIILDRIPSLPAPTQLPQRSGIIGYASEIPEVSDPRLRSALRALLGNTILAETAAAAAQGVHQGIADIAVALDGTLITRYGLHRGGSPVPTETALLGRKQKIAAFETQLAQLEADFQETQRVLQQVAQQLRNTRVGQLQEDIRAMEAQRHKVEQQIARIESQFASTERLYQRYQQELEALRKDRHLALQQTQKDSSMLEQIRQRKATLEQEIEHAQQKLHRMEEQTDAALQSLKRLEAELVDFKAALAKLQMRREQVEREKQQQQQRLATIAQQRAKAQAEREQLETQQQQLQQQLEQLTQSVLEQQQQVATQQQQVQQLRLQLQDKIRTLQSEQQHLQTLQQEIYELQLQIQTLTARIERLEEQAQEHFAQSIIQLERPTGEHLPDSPEAVRQEYQELKAKLERFGPVNLLAFEEYQKEKERLEFLQAQLADLLEAERTLKTTIQEINRTATRQFQEVFTRIRQRFQELFQLLFEPGDQADLLLEGEDPLEARIEIIAKPRGKRPHSIDMLSAGEKTLTAIALLFAIYYVKPSPFCILDEVDAPLDDANIDRFIKLLRDLNQHTQFILITHNKKTMEAADVLYGVTMGEDGVSTLVSVKLTDVKSQEAAAVADTGSD